MTDIEKSKSLLLDSENTIVLVKDDKVLISNEKGVKPLLSFIAEGTDLQGFSAADRIVGKAAAMLMTLVGIKEVYSPVMSKSATEFLKNAEIPYSCDIITDRIINRKGNGLCPMENAVMDITDVNEAYMAIKSTLEKLRSENNGN